MTRETPLRVAFNRYRSKVKRIELENNADIIKKFCRIVKRRRDNEKEKKNTVNISKAIEILSKINPFKKYAFDKIRKAKQIDGLNKIIDFINKKRIDILKEVFNKIKKGKNKNKLLKLFKIKQNAKDRLLRKYLKKWIENNDKIKKKKAAEKIQKNYKLYKNRKKKYGIKEILLRIINLKDQTSKNKFRTTLLKWLKNAKLKHANDSSKKIQKYLNKKTNINRAKKNWRKLVLQLSKKNKLKDILDIIKKIKQYFIILKLIKTIIENMKKNALKDLLKKLKYLKLQKILKKIITALSSYSKSLLLKLYLNKWKDKINKLKKLKEILEKMVNVIDKRRIIISAKILGDVFLIKKLFHDILRIRALEFIKRLKNSGELKKRLRALGDTLVKTKKDLDNQNKKIFLKSLYKVYYTRALDKLIKKIKEKQKLIKKKYGKYFINLLKRINLKKSEDKSQSKHQGSNELKNTRLQFRAHFSSPKAVTEDKNPYLYILPLFIEFLKNKIKERKEYSFKKILDKDKYNQFCRLIKKYIMKKQIPNKREFLDILKGSYNNLKTKGPLLEKLYKLLKKYIIHILMKTLKQPSKLYKIFYLFKMTFMHKGIAERRFIREIIRKWRFSTFVKVMAKRKLELMYKNLHISYLQMANEVFGDEESSYNASVVKEFERFGTDVGMWGNEDPNIPTESGYVKSVNKKYIFETLDNEKIKFFDEYNNDFETQKEIIVSDVKSEIKSNVKSAKSSSEFKEKDKGDEKEKDKEDVKDESFKRKRKGVKEDVKEKDDTESGRKIRTFNRKKEEEKKEDDSDKRGTVRIQRRSGK